MFFIKQAWLLCYKTHDYSQDSCPNCATSSLLKHGFSFMVVSYSSTANYSPRTPQCALPTSEHKFTHTRHVQRSNTSSHFINTRVSLSLTNTHTHTHTHTRTQTQTHTHIHIHTDTQTHTYTHTHIHTCAQTQIHTVNVKSNRSRGNTPFDSPLVAPDSDDLAEVHLHVVDLGDEDGCQGLIQSSAVHVDGGTHGQHKTCHTLVDLVVLLQALEGDWQSGRAKREEEREIYVFVLLFVTLWHCSRLRLCIRSCLTVLPGD